MASYSYDPFGRRFSKTTSAGTIYYMHDDRGNEIAEYAGSSATGAWTLERQMFHAPLELAPMAMLDSSGFNILMHSKIRRMCHLRMYL